MGWLDSLNFKHHFKEWCFESAKKVDAIAGRAAIPMYPLWGVARARALCALCDLYSKGYYDTVAQRSGGAAE